MKNHTSPLFLLLLGLGLVLLLAGDSEAKSEIMEECVNDFISTLASSKKDERTIKTFLPMITKTISKFNEDGGSVKLAEKLDLRLHSCVCKGALGSKISDKKNCGCIVELHECFLKNIIEKDFSKGAPGIRENLNAFLDCFGDDRLVSFVGCLGDLRKDPVEVMCKHKEPDCNFGRANIIASLFSNLLNFMMS